MSNARRLLCTNTASGGPAFDPLAAITWHTAFWASDSGWSNPGDGNAVSSWRDGSGNSRDLSQASGTKQPTYRASSATLNNQPAVEFSTQDKQMNTASFTALDQSAGYTAILIGFQSGSTDNRFIATYVSSGGRSGFSTDNNSGVKFSLRSPGSSSSVLNGSAVDTSAHFLRWYSRYPTTDTSTLGIDETTYSTNSNNAGHPTEVWLNAYGGLDGYGASITVAFAGLYIGNLTSNGQWSAFKTWAGSTYGITIA